MPCSPVDPELLRLLLPGPAEAPRRQRLLRLIEELALAEAAYAPAADPAPAGPLAETAELLELERGERVHCLELLARAYLGVGLDPAGFWSGLPSPGEAAAAWRALLGQRDGPAELPAAPAPGEAPLEVAERLLTALRAVEGPAFAERLWELRLCLARGGSGALAQRIEAEPASGGPPGAGGRRRASNRPLAERRSLLALEAELWLERGAPARVERLLEGHPLELALDGRLQRALALARLALGRPLGALATVLSAPPRGWPEAVLEWALVCPGVAAALGLGEAELERGRAALQAAARPAAPGSGGIPAEGGSATLERAALGAAALLHFELVPGGDPRLCASDLAPALSERLARFRAALPGALRDLRRAEAELLQSAQPVRRYAQADAELEGTLGPARALCLWPLFDREGELCGWMHCEWEHRLLPASKRLAQLARGLSTQAEPALGAEAAIRPLRSEEARVAESPSAIALPAAEAASAAARLPWPALELDDPRQRLAQAMAEGLGFKWGRRRWWCLELCAGRVTLVSHGGAGLFEWRRWPGEGRAWRRAARTGLPLSFDGAAGQESGLALCSASRSGLALPFVPGAVQCLWLIESERRGDFAPGDLERAATRLAEQAEGYERARLRAWSRSAGDGDLASELLWPGPLAELRALTAAQRWPAVRGPLGSGRSSLLAWMQFLRHEGGAPAWPRARFLPSFAPEDWRLLEEPGEPWVLAELASASPAAQERLAESLSHGPRGRPLLFELAPREEPFAPLAQQLSAGALELPPIGPLRAGLVPAIERLLARAAELERRPEPQLSDAALGCLWRAEWPRGLRQLAELLRRLVLLAPPQPVEAAVVEGLLRRAGLRPLRKLPSRHPASELLVRALEATGLENGRRNKTRAARLLGWDVDTLEARLAERGLG